MRRTVPQLTLSYYMNDPLFNNVVEYNWLDSALFDHFNNSMWRRVEEQKALGTNTASGLTWDEELAELKARVAIFTKNCGWLNYQACMGCRQLRDDNVIDGSSAAALVGFMVPGSLWCYCDLLVVAAAVFCSCDCCRGGGDYDDGDGYAAARGGGVVCACVPCADMGASPPQPEHCILHSTRTAIAPRWRIPNFQTRSDFATWCVMIFWLASLPACRA
jgi:hypothetical protein